MRILPFNALCLLLFASATWADEPSVPIPKTLPLKFVAEAANDGNQFAANLYARLRTDDSKNLFFSPYSIWTALGMTSLGAAGETQSQFAGVLHVAAQSSQSQSAIFSLQKMLNSVEGKSGFQLRMANRLWGQQGFRFRPEFLDTTKAYYGAELGQLDFQQTEAARKSINEWIEQQTDSKIQNLIAPGVLDSRTKLVLTNAIYFKSRWSEEFNKSLTADAPFHVSGTEQAIVPLMNQSHRFPYFESDSMQGVDLSYGQDGQLSMMILLPKAKDGLSDLEKQVSAETLLKWSKELKPRPVNLYLPRFKMTSEFSLKEVLTSMGLSLAFSDHADFSRMTDKEQLAISAVIHKAFVDVNEEGTEAAAATAVAMRPATARVEPQEPVEFRADHPFMFLIRHRRTQSVLFLGRVVKPQV